MSAAKQLEQFIDGLELRYFKGRELTPLWDRTRTAQRARHGLVKAGETVTNGVPPRRLWANIVEPLVVLDEIRHQCQNALYLTSTYRSPRYNAAVGGAPNSNHMQFAAIDFHAVGQRVSPRTLAQLARGMRGKKFKNPETNTWFTFVGGIGLYASFVHIDARRDQADW
jgi:hypothetical protein